MNSFKNFVLIHEATAKDDWNFLKIFGSGRACSDLIYDIVHAPSLPDSIKYHLEFSDFYKAANKKTESDFIRTAYTSTFEKPEEMILVLKSMEFSFEKFPMFQDCEKYYRLAQLPFPDFVMAILDRDEIEAGISKFKHDMIQTFKNIDFGDSGYKDRLINMFSTIQDMITLENLLAYLKPQIEVFENANEWRDFVRNEVKQFWEELCDAAAIGMSF